MDNIVLWITTAIALITAIFAIIKDWRKPTLDLANSDAVRAQIKKMSDETNNARDLRIWDLERWADTIWPWVRRANERMDQLCRLVAEDHEALGKPVPDLPHLEEPDPPPAPRKPV